jgi:hypothetical protein
MHWLPLRALIVGPDQAWFLLSWSLKDAVSWKNNRADFEPAI